MPLWVEVIKKYKEKTINKELTILLVVFIIIKPHNAHTHSNYYII